MSSGSDDAVAEIRSRPYIDSTEDVVIEATS
jgi:hypothetical protein